VTLVDAYALVAFLIGGPAAAQVRAILREGDAAIATVNLAEALDVSQRVRGLPISRALELLDPLFDGLVTVRLLDLPVACRAADLRARHYHRATRPISLADAVLLASAGSADRIATADPDVLAVARAEHLGSFALPGQG
jgi:PIN domain nuclease of toxin-antitoxin system